MPPRKGSSSFGQSEARAALWRLGRLRWKLRPHEWPLYDHIDGSKELKTVVKCSRRFGKTFTVLLWCTEQAIKRPGIQIRFAAPTEKALRKIVKPNLREILLDCPDDLRPKWDHQDSSMVFPNGSEWHFAGTDAGHAEKLRGTGTDIGVVDEAGSHDDLEYLDSDILLPQTIDRGGRLIFISTPAVTPAHHFDALCAQAEARGALYTRTIKDNTHLKPHEIERIVDAMGGWESTAVRRELMCESVVDESVAIVAEFTADRASRIVKPVEPLTHEWPLVAIDVGFDDLTAVLFGYWDFRRARLCIQAEWVKRRGRTDQIAAAIQETEARLWGEPKKPPMRWSDTDLRLIADLSELHHLGVQPTEKDDKEAQINALRMLVKDEKIQIDPSCVTLIEHLRTGIWNNARTEFARTKAHGHFDCIDALVYMLRNAPRYENPYPAFGDGFDPTRMAVAGGMRPDFSETAETFRGIYKLKGARR